MGKVRGMEAGEVYLKEKGDGRDVQHMVIGLRQQGHRVRNGEGVN